MKWGSFGRVVVALTAVLFMLLGVALRGQNPVSLEEVALAFAASAIVGLGLMWLAAWERSRFEQTETRVRETERRLDQVDDDVASVRETLSETLVGKRDTANAMLTDWQQQFASEARQAAEKLEHADVIAVIEKGIEQGFLGAAVDLRGELPGDRGYLFLTRPNARLLNLSIVDQAKGKATQPTARWGSPNSIEEVIAALGKRAADRTQYWPNLTEDVLVTLSRMVDDVGGILADVNQGRVPDPDHYKRIRVILPDRWAITDAGLIDSETHQLMARAQVHDVEGGSVGSPPAPALKVAQEYWPRT